MQITNVLSFRYVSCALGCPHEGHIEPSKISEVRKPFENPNIHINCYINGGHSELLSPHMTLHINKHIQNTGFQNKCIH